jgi:hypothetical protein
MSEVTKGDTVAPENIDHVDAQESNQTAVNDGKQSVKYETYSRVLSKLKNTENEFNSLKERLSSLEQEKLQLEGNKDQLIETLRKEVNERKVREKTIVGSIAVSQAKNAIVDEAVKAGCNSPEILTKILEDQIQGLEYDSEFRPDREQVKAMVEEARQKHQVLFSKTAPKVASHNLNMNGSTETVRKPLHKMTDDEINNLWSQFGALPESKN